MKNIRDDGLKEDLVTPFTLNLVRDSIGEVPIYIFVTFDHYF